jgi:hypothetical protein
LEVTSTSSVSTSDSSGMVGGDGAVTPPPPGLIGSKHGQPIFSYRCVGWLVGC